MSQNGIVDRAWRFGAAMVRSAANGFRQASQGTIRQRLEICSACDKFDGTRCTECGCNCNADASWLNKLSHASESCPLQKWSAGEMQPPPKITVGMATHRDFAGTYFTVRSLRRHHPEIADRLEILVVDNSPEFPDRANYNGPATASERLRQLLGMTHGGRYIPFDGVQGTSAPRDLVFREAAGEIVICIDSHVLLDPQALSKTVNWLDAKPNFNGLFHGPMLMDDDSPVTHMDPVWRSKMYGVWATLPDFDPLGEPREIPMHGLGLFGCRKKDWLGFNPAFREFGGEEGYIHHKYRQADRPVMLFPWLRWSHMFRDVFANAEYPSSMRARIRNYVIGWSELGLDIDEIREHFFGGPVPQFFPAEWAGILEEAAQLAPELLEVSA